MKSNPLNSGQPDTGYDKVFYRRVIKARSNADLLECRKLATRSRDDRIHRAFVRAMFETKRHRNAIAACLRKYIPAKRAIAALLWNLSELPPSKRMFQAQLLCILGHREAFTDFYYAMRESEPLDVNAKKNVESFLTDYTQALLPVMRSLLDSEDAPFVLLCARYIHKYYPREVSARVAEVAHESATDSDARSRALHILTAFSPESAVRCLLDCGGQFSLATLLSALYQLSVSESGQPLLPDVLHEFSQHHDERKLAATLFSPSQDDKERRLQFRWMTEQFKNRGDAGALSKTPVWVRNILRQHCHADHPEWVSFLETAASESVQ
jgi:hypothetical protein